MKHLSTDSTQGHFKVVDLVPISIGLACNKNTKIKMGKHLHCTVTGYWYSDDIKQTNEYVFGLFHVGQFYQFQNCFIASCMINKICRIHCVRNAF